MGSKSKFSRRWYRHDPWVISDTHFGHLGIVNFNSVDGKPVRPWNDVDQMNADLISNWNSVVAPDDLIIHLGDVSFGGIDVFHEVMPQLNGEKVLIQGNHDFRHWEDLRKYFVDVVSLLEIPKKAILTHLPVHPSQLDRFGVNVHGHLHQNTIPDSRYICVSVEQTNYHPVKLNDILN